MDVSKRLAALVLTVSSVSVLSLTAGTAEAAPILCGTTTADYAGATYELVQGSFNDQYVFQSNGTLTLAVNGSVAGTYTATLQALTLNVSRTNSTYTSTFRGCDTSLTQPGFVDLRAATSFPRTSTLTKISS
ncbi:hypothetical protein [Kitasatospora sp. NPDC058478]|uniref:hypothetical protein n=1 Tax=unclassified Kitasatospora TaxID=2633591 RepID=UPI003651AB89